MVKSALKLYYKNWRLIFIPMGIIYLALILSMLFLFSGLVNILLQGASESFDEIYAAVSRFFVDSDIGAMIDKGYAEQFFSETIDLLRANGAMVAASAKSRLTLSVFFVMACIVFAQKLTRSMLRKDARWDDSRRGLIVIVFRYLISTGLVFLFTWLSFLWVYSLLFTVIVYIVLSAITNLFSTWFLHYHNYPMSVILNGKSVLALVGTRLTTFFINVVSVMVIASVFSMFVGILLGIPLFAYNSAVNDVIGLEYFKKIIKSKPTLSESQPAQEAKKEGAVSAEKA